MSLRLVPPEPPRPLHPEARAPLLAVLNHEDCEGRDALVAQVDAARVQSQRSCGCATVGLVVDSAAPPAAGRTYWHDETINPFPPLDRLDFFTRG